MSYKDFARALIDVQSEVCICYYDYKQNKRIDITDDPDCEYREIKYIYCENDVIFFEVEGGEKE